MTSKSVFVRRVVITLSLSAIFALAQSPAASDAPTPHSFSGFVETLEGDRLPNATIQIANVGSVTTSASDEFTIPLPPSFQPRDRLRFSLGADWIIVSPWAGATFVSVGPEVIRVRVASTGDATALTDSDLVKEIVSRVESHLIQIEPGSGMDDRPSSEQWRKAAITK